MLEKLDHLDKKVFLFLNGSHNSFWDGAMYYFSKTEFWIPLYLILIYLLYKNYKTKVFLQLVLVAVALVLADQIPTSITKPYFQRPRPCHEVSLKGMVHVVKGCGGKYGFVSSHASNTFAAATLICLLLSSSYSKVFILYIWAILVSFSRIYLGKHYPGDVLGGAILGIVIGISMFQMFLILDKRIGNRFNLNKT